MVSPLLRGEVELYEGLVPEHALPKAAKNRLLYALVLGLDKAARI